MLFNKLKVEGKKSRKRVGRGIAAGQGKTAGRGTKGQASRSGYRTKPNFEGGQTPLVKRLPKLKGFNSIKTQAQTVNTDDLERVKGKTVNAVTLKNAGIIKNATHPIRVVLGGKVESAKNVEVQGVSAGAKKAIEKAGGTVKLVETHRFKNEAKTTKKTK